MSHVAFEAEVAARAEIPRSVCAHDFEQAFHALPQAEADAPGRVNLLGEHTEANQGFVLAVAIPQRLRVAMRRNGSSQFRLCAADLGRWAVFTLQEAPPEQFADYVYGCLRLAREDGADVPPLDIHIASAVPMRVGLASSAALGVATLRCLRELLGLELTDVRIAQLAQQAEIQDAGVRCASADAMAVSLAGEDAALLLDTRSLQGRAVPLPPGSAVLVLDAGGPTASACAAHERRLECEEAARLLGVTALRDVEHLEQVEALPDLPRRRARHMFTENARALQALSSAGDPQAFGALMNASHASLRDDLEVSSPAVDLLVSLLQREPGVYGARLTGAGFGRACVALCRSDLLHEIAHAVLEQFAAAGHEGRQLVPAAE